MSSADDLPAAPTRAMPRSMLGTGREDLDAGPRTLPLRVLAGAVPDDLRGHVFVSGSVAAPGRPVFCGEAVLYRIDLAAGAVSLTRAVLRPPCARADEALRGRDVGGLLGFRDLALMRLSPLLGVRTVLGTSPVALRDRLLVTTDAGRPWEVDPVTLELVTPIGKIDEWRPAVPVPWLFPLVLTSAHPGVDPRTGECFTVNFCSPGLAPGFCSLVRWRGPGPLEHFQPIDGDGEPIVIKQCVHQIGVTREHVILQDSAFLFEMRQLLLDAFDALVPVADLLRAHATSPHAASSVFWLIRRADLGVGGPADAPTPVLARRLEIPGESVHFIADHEDNDGIRLIVPHTPTLDVSEWITADDRMLDGGDGEAFAGLQAPCALTPGTIAVHTIDARTGQLRETRRTTAEATWGLGLSTQAPIAADRPVATVFFNTAGFFSELVPQRLARAYDGRFDPTAMPIADGRPPRLLAFDVASGHLTDWVCPNGWCVLTPVFVPGGGDPHTREGYVVCVAHAVAGVPHGADTSGEELWIFSAADITRGPICRLGAPDLDFAFTIHGLWLAELRPSPRDYRVSAAEDLDLDYLVQRSFGALSFWGAFTAAIEVAMQRDVVGPLLATDVVPHFDRAKD